MINFFIKNSVVFSFFILFSRGFTVFPDKNYEILKDNRFVFENNSFFYPIDVSRNKIDIYDALFEYRKHKICFFKEIQKKNCSLRLAHIELDININSSHINIEWYNKNFNSDNSLYIDYYFFNKTSNYPYFTEIDIGNSHHIPLDVFFKKIVFSNFSIIVKSNRYNIKEEQFFVHNDIVGIYSKKKHTSSSLCVNNFCDKNYNSTKEICYKNKKYLNGCHLFCSEMLINMKYIVDCKNNSTTISNPPIFSSLNPFSNPVTLSSTSTRSKIDLKNLKFNHSNYKLIFEGKQKCVTVNITNCRGLRFSTAKNNSALRHFILNKDDVISDCIEHCNTDELCKGIYLFYTVNNLPRCRGLSDLGNEGVVSYQHDYSYKYIGDKHIYTTPTTSPTTSPTSSPTTSPTTSPTSSLTSSLTSSQSISSTITFFTKFTSSTTITSKRENITSNDFFKKTKNKLQSFFVEQDTPLFISFIIGVISVIQCAFIIYLKMKLKKKKLNRNKTENKSTNIYNKLSKNTNRTQVNENYMQIDKYDTTSL